MKLEDFLTQEDMNSFKLVDRNPIFHKSLPTFFFLRK
jgi:hypothetical protein